MKPSRAGPDHDTGVAELALNVGEWTFAGGTSLIDVDDSKLIAAAGHRREAGRVREAERHLFARRQAHAIVVRHQGAAFDLFGRIEWKGSDAERGILRLCACEY